MDTKKLRQKILDLAIHGKLVPQDPNDEPASVLLERIRAEKERLIAEGKIKRSKKSATSDKPHYENVPFEVPEGWCWCTVDDFAYVAAGSTPNKDAFVDEGIPYIKMYNLRNQKIDFDFHPQYIKEEVHNGKLQRSRTEVGDLIMNIVGPPLGKLAFIPESLPQSNFNQAAVLIRPYIEKNTINRWLFYYLSEMSEINSISTKGSAGQVNISLTQSQNMRVPMPPLAEQMRITNKLDSLCDLMEGIESGIKDVNSVIGNFKSKILDLAIHGKLVPQDDHDEPASELLKRINPKAVSSCDNPQYEQIPDGWSVCSLDYIADILNGYAFKSDKYVDNGIRVIRIMNVQDGYIEDDSPKYYPMELLQEIKNYILNDGDLLMSLTGNVGRVGVIDKQFLPAALNQRVACIRIKAEINKEYLYYVFLSNTFKKDSVKSSKGVAQLNMSTEWLKQYKICIPPYNEQIRIVSKVKELFSQLDMIEKSLQA